MGTRNPGWQVALGHQVATFGGKVNKETSWPACQPTVLLCAQDDVPVSGYSAFRFFLAARCEARASSEPPPARHGA